MKTVVITKSGVSSKGHKYFQCTTFEGDFEIQYFVMLHENADMDKYAIGMEVTVPAAALRS